MYHLIKIITRPVKEIQNLLIQDRNFIIAAI
jgi:hypothetical protein